MAKVKRSQFATYLNTNPSGAAAYELIGVGHTTATINYNPKVLEETYIHEDSATISVESYAPNMPLEATAVNGDAVFEFVDGLRKSRAVLSAAETDVVNVWLYETPQNTDQYPAEKQTVSIQLDTFGGDGGSAAKITYTINFLGSPTVGYFDIGTKSWV